MSAHLTRQAASFLKRKVAPGSYRLKLRGTKNRADLDVSESLLEHGTLEELAHTIAREIPSRMADAGITTSSPDSIIEVGHDGMEIHSFKIIVDSAPPIYRSYWLADNGHCFFQLMVDDPDIDEDDPEILCLLNDLHRSQTGS